MPKRSLRPQQEVERLNQAIEAMLKGSGDNSRVPAHGPAHARLEIAAALRGLPREEFRTSLKNKLQRSTFMTTAIEATPAVRTFAAPRLAFKNVAKAMEFYAKAFGARETFR